jgi:hypothetical protein
MEPENKKEIMIGWWKFVGLQAAVVLVMSLVFYSSGIYPEKLEEDFRKKNRNCISLSEGLMQAENNISVVKDVLLAYQTKGKMEPADEERIKEISDRIKNNFTSSPTSKAYLAIPNFYQELANKYLDSTRKLKELRTIMNTSDVAALQSEIMALKTANLQKQMEYTQYVSTHCSMPKSQEHP